MKLNIKTIKNFANINQLAFSSEWTIRQEDQTLLYFQLVDSDQSDLRYLPTDSTYGVFVSFPNTANSPLIKTATQVSALDRSVWSIQINSADLINTGNFQVSVVEGSIVKKFSVMQGITVEALNGGGC